jgi:hypothetical protein
MQHSQQAAGGSKRTVRPPPGHVPPALAHFRSSGRLLQPLWLARAAYAARAAGRPRRPSERPRASWQARPRARAPCGRLWLQGSNFTPIATYYTVRSHVRKLAPAPGTCPYVPAFPGAVPAAALRKPPTNLLLQHIPVPQPPWLTTQPPCGSSRRRRRPPLLAFVRRSHRPTPLPPASWAAGARRPTHAWPPRGRAFQASPSQAPGCAGSAPSF